MGAKLGIVIAMLTMIGAYYTMNQRASMADNSKKLADSQYEVLARNAALDGYSIARQHLSQDYREHSTIEGTSESARYRVTFDKDGSRIDVESLGISGSTGADSTVYVVRASFDMAGNGGLPEFMKAGITSDGNFKVEDDVTISSVDGTQNANVHTNGNIEIESGTVSIEGFGFHKGNADSNNGQSLSDIFSPNSNPSGMSSTQKVSEIDVPLFEADDHSHLATSTFNGDLELAGPVVLGSESAPEIVHVKGNLKTTGNVTISGNVLFMVEGNVEVEHHVLSPDAADHSVVGFYTTGNIIVKKGSLNLSGQWFANGNITLESNTVFDGTITTDGNVELKGPASIGYRPASSGLAPMWSTPSAPQLVSYFER